MLVVSHGRRSLVEKMIWALKICNDCGIRGEWLHNLVCPYRAKIVLQCEPRALPSATMGSGLWPEQKFSISRMALNFLRGSFVCPERVRLFVVALTTRTHQQKEKHEHIREETGSKHYLV